MSWCSVHARRLERTISDFIPQLNFLLGVNDNFFHATDGDDFSRAVRVTGVVDKPPAGSFRSTQLQNAHRGQTHPRLPFFVASTTRSSSILKR